MVGVELHMLFGQSQHALAPQQRLQVQGDNAVFLVGLQIPLTASNATPMLEALHRGCPNERLQQESVFTGGASIGDSDVAAENAGP